jgi:anti-sigma factor RsiW
MTLLAKMTCPRAELLGQFVDDQVDETERVTIEDHLDACEECRRIVAVLAKAATRRDDKTDATAATAFADLVGRPIHLSELGDRRAHRAGNS